MIYNLINCKLISICKDDDLASFKNYTEHIQKYNYLIRLIINYYFRISCQSGSIQIVKYIIENYLFLNLSLSLKTILNLINNKKLNILKIIYDYDIYSFTDYRVLYYAASKDLDILKWLDSLETYNLSYNSEYTLYKACISENLNIIEWLIQQKCDYQVNNHYIFKICCFRKKKITLDYLVSINYIYGYEIKYYSSSGSNYKIIPKIKKYNLVQMINLNHWKEIIDKYKIIIEKIEFSDLCSICYQDSNFITNCNHNFDFVNLMKWYIKKNECPLCKTKISLNECKINRNYYNNL